jgi:surface protein
MKTINNYINEALIKKDTKIDEYSYHPKNIVELQNLIKKLVDDRGINANLNDIDISQIKNMNYLFTNAFGPSNKILQQLNVDVSEWDVSNVRNMEGMFSGLMNFNCDLSNWDVSEVRNMTHMFRYCKLFNQNLGSWNIVHVNQMACMFLGCDNFIGDGLENWKPNRCNDFRSMFRDCTKFKANLENWKIKKDAKLDYMFSNCKSIAKKNRPSWYNK